MIATFLYHAKILLEAAKNTFFSLENSGFGEQSHLALQNSSFNSLICLALIEKMLRKCER